MSEQGDRERGRAELAAVPPVVVVCGTVVVLAFLGAVVALALAGKSTDDVRWLVNVALNALGFGAAGLAGEAARRAYREGKRGREAAETAAQRLNGGLDERIATQAYQAVQAALTSRGAPAVQDAAAYQPGEGR